MAAGMRGQVSNFGIIHRKPDGQLVAQSFGLLRIARGSKASRQLEASFLFLFPASMPSSMSSTRIRLSLKRWLFAMRSTAWRLGWGATRSGGRVSRSAWHHYTPIWCISCGRELKVLTLWQKTRQGSAPRAVISQSDLMISSRVSKSLHQSDQAS